MFSDGEKLKQLKIYYLFMRADGKSSLSEKRYLDDILTKSDLSDERIKEFRTFCGQVQETPESVIEEIDNVLGQKPSGTIVDFCCISGPFFRFRNIDRDKVMQAQTIWTLINLGYADNEYSEAEKQVVNHLVQRWEMDPALVDELNDTADTILALTQQKEWIRKTARPAADIDRMLQELDQNIKSIKANVEASISEANIA